MSGPFSISRSAFQPKSDSSFSRTDAHPALALVGERRGVGAEHAGLLHLRATAELRRRFLRLVEDVKQIVSTRERRGRGRGRSSWPRESASYSWLPPMPKARSRLRSREAPRLPSRLTVHSGAGGSAGRAVTLRSKKRTRRTSRSRRKTAIAAATKRDHRSSWKRIVSPWGSNAFAGSGSKAPPVYGRDALEGAHVRLERQVLARIRIRHVSEALGDRHALAGKLGVIRIVDRLRQRAVEAGTSRTSAARSRSRSDRARSGASPG